jgi:hypothetical protein
VSDKTIYEKLHDLQLKIAVPKGETNEFGGYKYRTAEGILQAAKAALGDSGLTILLTDQIQLVGDRYYVQAIAKITDGKESVEVSAFAREELSKKGMDASQITGSASSYARKYALNGLFAIDGTADADSMKPHEAKVIDDGQLSNIVALMDEVLDEAAKGNLVKWLKTKGVKDGSVNNLPDDMYELVVKNLERKRGS